MLHVAVVPRVLILFVSVGYFFFLTRPDEHTQRVEVSFVMHSWIINKEMSA
tara:strand:- start:446 stop:598 length:153 start_codon:yes stop_codon:yes gene_type:complete